MSAPSAAWKSSASVIPSEREESLLSVSRGGLSTGRTPRIPHLPAGGGHPARNDLGLARASSDPDFNPLVPRGSRYGLHIAGFPSLFDLAAVPACAYRAATPTPRISLMRLLLRVRTLAGLLVVASCS